MTRDQLLAKLRDLKPWLEEQGVANLRLFGSFARDEAGPDSDVDLLVDVELRVGLLTLIGLERQVGEHLGGRKVDLCELAQMENPYLRHYILTDAVPV